MPGRVLVCDRCFPLDAVRDLLTPAGVAIEAIDPPPSGEDVVGLLVGPDCPIGSRELDRLPALRIVATCSVGYDHVDVATAAGRGVVVANVPDYCLDEMADSTLALLLSLLRGTVVLDRSVQAGGWDDHAAGPLPRLRGTTLGIVGFGRIGRAVAERALALGMEVLAHDPAVPAGRMRSAGTRPASLPKLLAESRAVTLHVPLTSETRGLLGADELALLPPGAVLVNTARARLVDLDALAAALDAGGLAAAAFDVLPVEPPLEPPRMRNLVVTPHAAWYSERAETEVYRRPALAVLDVLEGRGSRDAVPAP